MTDLDKKVRKIFRAVEKADRIRKKKIGIKKEKTPKKNKPVRKVKPVSEQKEKRRAKKGLVTGPTVTIKEIAYDHEIDPKKLRRLLRGAGIKRPEGRWEWSEGSKEVKNIIKLIKEQ